MRALSRQLAAVVFAFVLCLSLAAQAPAASHHPKGEYAPFDECPLSIKTLSDCVYSVSSKGGFAVGPANLSLYTPLILQGGFEGVSNQIKFRGAENGETLSNDPQPLAGLLEARPPLASWPKFLRDWFNTGVEKEAHIGASVYTELAAPASEIKLNTENLLFEEGTVLGLPLKIRLENELLGDHCYVGSDAKPIELKYTSGKSGALKGDPGSQAFNSSYRMSTTSGVRLVDGTFAVPRAEGCGGLFSNFVDPLIDSIFELPSPPGKSGAVLEGTLKDAQAEAVRESEGG